MKKYEMIREIYTLCDNGKNSDVLIEEVETDDVHSVILEYCRGKKVEIDRTDKKDGSIQYDLLRDGLKERITFSEI